MVGNVAFASFDIYTQYNGYEKSGYRSVDRGVNWTRVSIPLGQVTSPVSSTFKCMNFSLCSTEPGGADVAAFLRYD